jgi:hypothetical protein
MQRTDANVVRVRRNSESTVLFGSADRVKGICSEEKTPFKWILHHDNAPAHDALKEFASFWLRNPLKKWTIYFIHLS